MLRLLSSLLRFLLRLLCGLLSLLGFVALSRPIDWIGLQVLRRFSQFLRKLFHLFRNFLLSFLASLSRGGRVFCGRFYVLSELFLVSSKFFCRLRQFLRTRVALFAKLLTAGLLVLRCLLSRFSSLFMLASLSLFGRLLRLLSSLTCLSSGRVFLAAISFCNSGQLVCFLSQFLLSLCQLLRFASLLLSLFLLFGSLLELFGQLFLFL